jgi:class 3 adenylate cyclase
MEFTKRTLTSYLIKVFPLLEIPVLVLVFIEADYSILAVISLAVVPIYALIVSRLADLDKISGRIILFTGFFIILTNAYLFIGISKYAWLMSATGIASVFLFFENRPTSYLIASCFILIPIVIFNCLGADIEFLLSITLTLVFFMVILERVSKYLLMQRQELDKAKNAVEKEKRRSEDLLLNILPAQIVHELKIKGHADARGFEMVSVLFTDFKGFTAACAKLNAHDLVNELHECFATFDKIVENYNIEKIKTIGDAYMAAGGIPETSKDAAKNTVLAALEMQNFITDRKRELDHKDLSAFEMRVGVHTGPVVAGIVGVNKFQYDIWGDTVNTASRMENACEVGKVNISQTTYDLLKDHSEFSFQRRGRIEVKGKGEIEMYFVTKN